MLIDSDVIIWYLRGYGPAREHIESRNFSCSCITYMEILQGAKTKKELKEITKFFKDIKATILPLTENISTRAQFLIEEYCLSHSLEIADALIAATAIDNKLKLLTGNSKHYKQIPNLKIIQFK